MLGAYLSFGATLILGRPFVEAILAPRHWATIDHWSERHGGSALSLSRLVPVISFDLINCAAGLTTISWWTFTVAGDERGAVAAFVPGTVVCLEQGETGRWAITWMVRPELAPPLG